MKQIPTYGSLNEEQKAGGWSAIMKGVKSGGGSGPWCLVAIQEWVDGKRAAVVGQELVNTKEAIPAAYEGFKRQYPKAHIHIENAGGQTVWSEKK